MPHRAKALQPAKAGSGRSITTPPPRPNSTSERLVSRVTFLDEAGQQHSTSIWSTKPLDFVLGTELARERIAQYKATYEAQGYRVLKMEFITQTGWELS